MESVIQGNILEIVHHEANPITIVLLPPYADPGAILSIKGLGKYVECRKPGQPVKGMKLGPKGHRPSVLVLPRDYEKSLSRGEQEWYYMI